MGYAKRRCAHRLELMKKLLVLMVGLGLVLTTVTPTFAAGAKKHKKSGKGGGKRGGTRGGPAK
jgi:hypothetical protein